jgi:hypothetical protein
MTANAQSGEPNYSVKSAETVAAGKDRAGPGNLHRTISGVSA